MLGKIKYVLKKNLNMKTSYVVGLTVLSLFLVVGGLSVALYTSQAESRGSLNIMTGDLISLLEGEELIDNQIRVEGEETKRITITLKNKNTKDAKFNLYYTPIEGVEVKSYSGLKPPTEEGIVLNPEEEKTYKVEIHNTKGEAQQITFGSDVGLSTKNLSFPKEKNIIDVGNDPNNDINALYNIIKTQTKGIDEKVDFASSTINSGVYTKHETMDDVYPVYYYRGLNNEINNHLLFAGFCWKIVRTTDTGGIKLIYNGTPTDTSCLGTAPTIGNQSFNKAVNSIAYSGYMSGKVYPSFSKENGNALYGNDVSWDGSKYTLQNTYQGDDVTQLKNHHYTCFSEEASCSVVHYIYYVDSRSYYVTLENGVKIDDALDSMLENHADSSIKTVIDNWYKTNIEDTGNGDVLEDTVWCNDRSISVKSGWDINGAPNSWFDFSSRDRRKLSQLTVQCPNVRDSFTVSSANGNGKLDYPVGLLTVDEASLAGNGLRQSYQQNSYLTINQAWWLLSPIGFWDKYYIKISCVEVDGYSSERYSENYIGVRPAISLKSGAVVTEGNGTSELPYKISFK